MEIIELRPSLYLVRVEFGQLYLWRDGDAVTLVDTGCPARARRSPRRWRAWGWGRRRSSGQ